MLRQVLERTGNPRLAAVLAMDLMLVGLDTVRTRTRSRRVLAFVSDSTHSPSVRLQSSVSTATSLYHLARNPAAQERLFAELRRLMPRPDSPLDAATADQMHYLRACVREALRYASRVRTQFLLN